MSLHSPSLFLVLYGVVARNLIIVVPYVGHPDDRMSIADSQIT